MTWLRRSCFTRRACFPSCYRSAYSCLSLTARAAGACSRSSYSSESVEESATGFVPALWKGDIGEVRSPRSKFASDSRSKTTRSKTTKHISLRVGVSACMGVVAHSKHKNHTPYIIAVSYCPIRIRSPGHCPGHCPGLRVWQWTCKYPTLCLTQILNSPSENVQIGASTELKIGVWHATAVAGLYEEFMAGRGGRHCLQLLLLICGPKYVRC